MADPEEEDVDVLYEEVEEDGVERVLENSLRAILNGGTLGGPRRIKAATLPKLVDLIAAKHPAAHLPFEQMLVDCHSLYCSSAQFINVIIAKYECVKDDEEQSQAKIKTLRLLRMLLAELLLNNPESKAVETIRLFAQAQEAQFGSDILETIAQARSKEAPKSKAVWSHMEEEPDPPILLLSPDAQVTKLDEVDPRELAKQLTLLLAKQFARLRPREYAHFLRTKASLFDLIYNHKLNDAQVKRKMGHLAAIIAHFCGLVHWLRREINESIGPRRAKVLNYIFRFAWAFSIGGRVDHMKPQELFRMRNLHALGAVVLVLSPHFDDLQQMLPPSDVNKLTELALLFHSSETETLDGSFEFSHSTKRGRDLLYQTHSACLPFLGTYLHGMQIINATEAAFDDDQLTFLKTKNMLNLQKMERLSLVLKLLQQFQDRWYGYERVETIRDYIKRGIEQGLRSMQLRPLGHLCREAVWRHKVDWRRHKLPCELTEFLAQHQVRLGDVLSVLSSL